ncbi:unnamed protein product [Cylicocyclus nassatus]|uniref:Sodium/hydrogen exchanger n=1 Tax=Cylicocyclus nassatus TaxID=53992 RepID=A0AA36H361_CYLNA|nr:unnamed protein product [Cylicocyclus nassatus]
MTFRWEENETPYMITAWLLIAALAKILFHLFKPLSKLPDSALLIVVGLLLGLILKQSGASIAYSLNSHVFFLYLLPPIIFDAGYFMPNRALFENIDSVLLFAVVGTIWNSIAIGGSLLLLSHYGVFSMAFSTTEIFVFSALISAVDPVAVIAVFEEIKVNEFIFVNVFGEALFNDGVTVVLYQMFKSFTLIGPANIKPIDYGAAALSFFVVACGGALLGIIAAILVSWMTKYTNQVRILAPVFIFVIPYMAYLTAEVTSLSSIIAIAVCGMIMKQYVKGNISTAAGNSVKYFVKMLAQSSETVIFMFLGLSTMYSEHYWDTAFVVASVVFCLLFRTIGVLVQCFFLNKFRGKRFTKVDQLILSYGGLRGAIAFGLAISIPETILARRMFITTTLVVIFFTVFLQGMTIRPLVNYLKVKTKDDRPPTMAEIIYNKYLDYAMSGVEDIAGQKGHYTLRDNFEQFNAKFLQPILVRNEKKKNFDASSIVRAYQKITLEDAMNLTKLQEAAHRRRARDDQESALPSKSKEILQAESLSTPPQARHLEQFLANGENVDSLYALFSGLLDKKLKELNTTRQNVSSDAADDIQDDYMRQIASTTDLNSDPLERNERRRSTGGIRNKNSVQWTQNRNV